MIQDVDEGDDWRSVATRSQDAVTLETAQQRAREPDRGRIAFGPGERALLVLEAGRDDVLGTHDPERPRRTNPVPCDEVDACRIDDF